MSIRQPTNKHSHLAGNIWSILSNSLTRQFSFSRSHRFHPASGRWLPIGTWLSRWPGVPSVPLHSIHSPFVRPVLHSRWVTNTVNWPQNLQVTLQANLQVLNESTSSKTASRNEHSHLPFTRVRPNVFGCPSRAGEDRGSVVPSTTEV